ncbi:GAF domain-containing protein [Halopelagius longus]|uniref:GAF domain-containing protein n=1 Tax=Halopelagius longus TaxID=1236180 RepID=A0A1H1B3N9_9EURY|nr:GAF domain-containing protein [Halopelagius longus]RDI70627.1 GAF domain-containing protein [Halopelagius longus]SDQ46523.1 GAF domain-containing protein, putative methionine-R-sulfoxide reductase [Halopelagius longus]
MTPENDDAVAALLRDVLEEFDCVSGTLHRAEEGELKLVAHEGIPNPVLAKIETVPIGKGMAGLAAERREPVQVCNLQTDDSGVAEPGARETMMEGSIAAPILGSDGTLEGTIGIAKPEPYEFTSAERGRLMNVGAQIVQRL